MSKRLLLTHIPESRHAIEQGLDLRLDLRNALWLLGEIASVFDYLREAQRLAEALNDRHRLGWVVAFMCNYFRRAGQPEEAIEYGQRAAAIGGSLGDLGLGIAANYYLGTAYYDRGDYARATEVLNKNATSIAGELLRERFRLPGLPAVLSRTWLVWCLAEQGAFAEGVARGAEGVQIAEAADHPYRLTSALSGLGRLYLRMGTLGRAIPLLERGLDIARTWNIRLWVPPNAAALGSAYALSERMAEALPLLEEAVERGAWLGSGGLSWWVACLSEGYLLANRMDDVRESARRALHLSHQNRERGNQAYALRVLGEIASHRDPPDVEQQAEASYRDARALAEELGMRPLVAHCHLGLGTLFRRTGKRDEARDHLTTATTLYRETDMRCWLEKAEAIMGALP